jgi:hypothetical protein
MSFFHRHNWSDWAILERGQLVDRYCPQILGCYINQERFCQDCGKHQLNQQRAGTPRVDVQLVTTSWPARQPQKDRV